MDEHSIKKKRCLPKILAISAGIPAIFAPLVDIVKAYPIDVLDEFFSKISRVESDIYIVYNDKCNRNNDAFVQYILNN